MSKLYTSKFESFSSVIGLLVLSHLISCQSQIKKNQDHLSYVDSIRARAIHMVEKGNIAKAKIFFDSAYQLIPNPGIGDEVRRHNFMGQTYYPKLEDYKNAISSLDSIFLIVNTKELIDEYKRDYATAVFQKGDWLFKLNKYSEAYHQYYTGKLIAETILDNCALSEFSYRLGMVSYKQGKYRVAASNFKQCFNAVDYCVKDFRIYAFQQELLANTSLSYSKCGMIDSSIVYSNKALAYIVNNEKRFPDHAAYSQMAKGVIYGNQAAQHLVKHDTVYAEKLLKRSYEINRKKGFDNVDAQLTLLKLGQLYIQTNRLEDALETSEMLRASLDTSYNLKVDIGLNEIKWNYHSKLNQTDQAFIYLRNFVRLKDSLDISTKSLAIADVDKAFQSIEQQYKYNLLSKDNAHKKMYLYVAVIFSMMAMLILFLLWKNWKTFRKNVTVLTFLNKQVTFQNKQLEQTLADLKQSSDDKDRILKVVAHDLRNPIGAIANISSILLEEVEFSPIHKQMLEMVKDSSWQSIEMINGLLNASLSQRPSEMNMEWVLVSDLIHKCVDQIKFKAEEKGQQIRLDLEDGIRIKADREKLMRVVCNLIINAIKFSPLNTAITVQNRMAETGLELSVKDNGIGIPQELGDHLFEMFGNSKRYGTMGEQPFGIGLPFSKQIVEAHGGEIWFESEENKGTVFYVRLPQAEYMVEPVKSSVSV